MDRKGFKETLGMVRKKDFGLSGMKTDRKSMKETLSMERKKDFGLGGTQEETLLKLKHSKTVG